MSRSQEALREICALGPEKEGGRAPSSGFPKGVHRPCLHSWVMGQAGWELGVRLLPS